MTKWCQSYIEFNMKTTFWVVMLFLDCNWWWPISASFTLKREFSVSRSEWFWKGDVYTLPPPPSLLFWGCSRRPENSPFRISSGALSSHRVQDKGLGPRKEKRPICNGYENKRQPLVVLNRSCLTLPPPPTLTFLLMHALTLPSPCMAFSQALSVNSLWWRIRGERITWPKIHWPRGIMSPKD